MQKPLKLEKLARTDIPKRKYVVAVSGGLDSMVLLDILAQQVKSPKSKVKSGFKLSALSFELIIAHFNHGIRTDSDKDEELVRKTAEKYNLPFEVGYGHLGPNASEDTARKARYEFLEKIRREYGAKAIITAHHQDDLLETAFINILRGTRRRGLSSIIGNPKIIRPLLKITKKEILSYAKKHHIKWREDITNKDERYLRNYLRAKIIPKISQEDKENLTKNLEKVAKINKLIDNQIATISQSLLRDGKITRHKFALLPTEIGNEVMAYWLREQKVPHPDSMVIQRLSVFIKTGQPGSATPVRATKKLKVDKLYAYIL